MIENKSIYCEKVQKSWLTALILLFFTTALSAQTAIDIAPNESAQIAREHTITILPLTDVTISILGPDSLYVVGVIDSFVVTPGSIKVKTYYKLFVMPNAPLRELSVQVLLDYKASNVLSQKITEDFLIDAAVAPSILAEFTADPLQGTAPLSVNFTNASQGDIVAYSWDFGDGSTSVEANPQHTYTAPGLYTITLIAANFTTFNTVTRENYIRVQDPTAVKNETDTQPLEFTLLQNYPNPFNPVTTISYSLKETSPVALSVYNTNGQRMKILVSQIQSSGQYNVPFDASTLPSGIYIYKLQANDFVQTRSMLLLR
ncbi:MAG: PKD domain-containing protein [Deferribacteres bacterium]|nr:PKD domain-containing protein [Deferribacteres bacterium]